MMKLTKESYGYSELKEWVEALDDVTTNQYPEDVADWACYQLLPGLKDVLAYFDSIDDEE